MHKKQQLKQSYLNGLNGHPPAFKDGYWFPRDFPNKDEYFSSYVWPDGQRIKTHLTNEELILDYKKRYDVLLAKPYGSKVLEMYREEANKSTRTYRKGKGQYYYKDELGKPIFWYHWMNNTGIPEFIENEQSKIKKAKNIAGKLEIKQHAQAKIVEQKEQTTKKLNRKKYLKLTLIGVGSLAVIGVGSYFILKKL